MIILLKIRNKYNITGYNELLYQIVLAVHRLKLIFNEIIYEKGIIFTHTRIKNPSAENLAEKNKNT